MSEAKLRKFINRPLIKPTNKQKKTALILSDSKARYIREWLEDSDVNIIWWAESGSTTENRLEILKGRLRNLVVERSDDSFIVYVWTGTCDLTYKYRGLTYLKSVSDTLSTQYLKTQFLQLKQFCSKFTNVQVLLLELPPYSIYQYNTRSRGSNPVEVETLKSLDKTLFGQIEEINSYIRELNKEDGFVSPSFKNDVMNNRKSNNRKSAKSFNYKLMKDGIHPDELLSRAWMRRILTQIYLNCY